MNSKLFDWGFKIATVICFSIIAFLFVQKSDSIVYVEADKIVAQYKGTQKARSDFEHKAVIWQANLDTLKREAESQMKEFQNKSPKLSANERKLAEEVVRLKQEQFENYKQGVREKIQKEEQELSKNVLVKVNDYLKRYGEKNGYRIIMAATQAGNIVYGAEGTNITKQVLKGLNEEYH